MKLSSLKLLPILAFLAVSPAQADLETKMQGMCDKMKTCSLDELKKQQDVPPEMKAMMEGMFNNMCVQWMQPYTVAMGEAGLSKKAEACIDTVLNESCERLMQTEGKFESAACKEFEQAADKAGVDLDNINGQP